MPVRLGVISSNNQITKKIMNFAIKSRYRKSIVLLYSFRIVSAGRDSMLAGCDLPFQFNKSQNLSFSIVLGFKTIIFDKFIVYYRILSLTIEFLRLLSNFY